MTAGFAGGNDEDWIYQDNEDWCIVIYPNGGGGTEYYGPYENEALAREEFPQAEYHQIKRLQIIKERIT